LVALKETLAPRSKESYRAPRWDHLIKQISIRRKSMDAIIDILGYSGVGVLFLSFGLIVLIWTGKHHIQAEEYYLGNANRPSCRVDRSHMEFTRQSTSAIVSNKEEQFPLRFFARRQSNRKKQRLNGRAFSVAHRRTPCECNTNHAGQCDESTLQTNL
jgi:hypothetical protein